MIRFKGEIPASKSVLIRALLAQAYEPRLEVQGSSRCDDVVQMKSALRAFDSGQGPIDCGESGLVFRLLAVFGSRLPGSRVLLGHGRLLERPHGPLFQTLSELGVSAEKNERDFVVHSTGWKNPGRTISLDRSISSQFASALLLNAWGLEFPLRIELIGEEVSSGYFDISLAMARALGMDPDCSGSAIHIPAGQKIVARSYQAELDMSSAFAVAALAAMGGEAEITNFSDDSRQPDAQFVSVLASMGVPLSVTKSELRLSRAEKLRAIQCDLSGSPDLFPVLAVLCAFAEGTSVLYGAPHLRNKESDRIASTGILLQQLGVRFAPRSDGMEIYGNPGLESQGFIFNPQGDHRLVMAAAVARARGAKVQIANADVVSKSFPEFLTIAGLPTGLPRAST